MNGNGYRTRLDQRRAPIHEALENFRRMRVVPFDVPGHKRGRGNPELTAFLGEQCVGVDVNSMKPLDNLCHPVSVIREAEELAADAFGAAHAFLMVGGTTSSVQSMVLSACKRGDEIILPRNVHRSVLNALVLCGAVPVYVNPEVDQRLGISLGMRREQVAKAIAEHPNAVAVLVNNPTYYGICSDLRAIVRMAHEAGMLCLADEAHGTHFYFGGGLPVSAMAAGADMAAVSMHKSGGSLTQSSLLLTGPNVHAGYVRQIINLTQTTSGSYLLMSSLDISRRNLALRGRQVFHQVADMAEYAREEINAIGGYYAFGKELCNGNSIFDFDTTKLSIHTRDIGLAGIEVYDILRDEYDIQIEFGDLGNILAYLSMGWNGWSAPWPRSNAATRPTAPACSTRSTSTPRWWPAPSRPSMPKKSACPCARPWAACAASSSCATPRASPSWPRASASPPRSWTISSTPKPRAAA